MAKIGFIGLGNMGRPMVRNLMKAGHEVKVFDIVEAAVNEMVDEGAIRGQNCKDTAAGVDLVITMLPNSPHVEKAVFGEDGVAEGIKKGHLLIEMSSISPIVTQQIAAALLQKGIRMIDAPVTGGVPGATGGTLGIMVGGANEDLYEAMPVLNILGKKIVHVGSIGMGQTAKVCNQIVVGASFCAVSEAMVLGTKAGIEPSKLQEVLNSGSAHCWALEAKIPNVIAGNFEAGFMIDLQHKDIGLALDTGKELHVPLNFAALAHQTYEAARAMGLGRKDHSAVIQVLEKVSGQTVRGSK